MSTWDGILRFVDLGMGQWVVELPDGQRLPLWGDVPASLRDCAVRVRGQVVSRVGFGLDAQRSIQVSDVQPR